MVDPAHADPRLDGERVQIGEVGEAGQADGRHVESGGGGRRRPGGPHQCERVLGVEVEPPEVRQDAERRDAAAVLQFRRGPAQERAVPPEPVDDEALHLRGQLVGQEGHRAEQVREDPAALDVPDHYGGDAGPSRQTEVDEVVAEQVDLGGAPGALADDDVEPGAQ